MNYYGNSGVLIDRPFSNPITKAACGVGLLWVGYTAIKYATKQNSTEPMQRRARQGFTTSKVDHAIDSRNKAFGKPVPSNPNVPFDSRHNYNRRRRSKNFW